MDELPLEVGERSTGVVTLGGRQPAGWAIVTALIVVVGLAIAIGAQRSSDHAAPSSSVPSSSVPSSSVPSSTVPVVATTAAPTTTAVAAESAVTLAVPTVTASATNQPASFPSVPALAGYILRGMLVDGTVFAVDLGSGSIKSWIPVSVAVDRVEAHTPASFVVIGQAGRVVISIDANSAVANAPPGQLITSETGFAILSDADEQHQRALDTYGPRGEHLGTLAALPWPESVSVAGLTGDQIVLEGSGTIYHFRSESGPAGTVTTSQGGILATGHIFAVGGGMVAYSACDASLVCRVRFRPAVGGREVTSQLDPNDMDERVATFTPDGKTFLTVTFGGDGRFAGDSSRLVTAIDTATGVSSDFTSAPGDRILRGGDAISVTSDNRMLVWEFDDRTLAFRNLRDGTNDVVVLPVHALYLTITPE